VAEQIVACAASVGVELEIAVFSIASQDGATGFGIGH
jgi:hypothetical protein